MEPWRGRGGRGGGGRGGGGRGPIAGRRPVAEADRISIVDRLNQFKASNEQGLFILSDCFSGDFCILWEVLEA